MADSAYFKKSGLMALKPALHPFDISMTKDKSVSFNMSKKATETRYSNWNQAAQTSTVNQTPQYLPPNGYVPKFSSTSKLPSVADETRDTIKQPSTRSLKKTSTYVQSAKNVLGSSSKLTNQVPFDDDLPVFDSMHIPEVKPSLIEELQRVKNQLEKANRYQDVMKDLRRVSDKQFVLEMDQAIANVKSSRVPSKKDI